MRFDAKKWEAKYSQPGLARALQRLKQARLIEAEALGEIMVAIASDETATRSTIPETARGVGEQNGLPPSKDDEGYLSIKQVAQRTNYKEKTLRNFISAGELTKGLHYFKRRGRLMFVWAAIEKWVEESEVAPPASIPLVRSRRHGRSS